MPNAKQWAQWLRSNLPPYIGEIVIDARWETGSELVSVILPVEIWLALPERDAYFFVDYHRNFDAAAARKKMMALLAPQTQKLQEQIRPGTAGGGGSSTQKLSSRQGPARQLVMRSGNVP